jgi:hypothetical protein
MLGAKNSPPSGEETLAADTGISLAVEKETRVVFSTTATIPGKSSVHVAFEYLRLLRPPDIVLVSASQATVGLKLKVLSDPLRCEVVALHPDSGALVSVGNEWTFSPAFLPWQGFQIKILPPSSAATT